jgi:hypothetical protein
MSKLIVSAAGEAMPRRFIDPEIWEMLSRTLWASPALGGEGWLEEDADV